jgi:hypothetical protein
MEKEIEKEVESSHADLQKLMEKNAELLEENNNLLKKIHRNGVWAFWVRVAWYVVIVGLPFALYFYVLEPYFTALGSNYEVFRAGINEVPGLRQLTEWINAARGE